ncbi:MAG: isoprenylcysteine carboxylmethyltransferase family protein [Planctomycetes bacterium]|nr:isoprenylcysteine carboxylmethyltransferase family protein [Planctomycetota bacterium]
MWVIRIVLLVMLGAMVGADSLLLRHRRKYARLARSRVVNVALVTAHLAVTFALVTLPPAGGWNARPGWLRPGTVCVGFGAVGAVLVCAGMGLALLALRQRKAVGLQDSQEGLITWRAYRYFRHPIYVGILWTSLGLALLTRNPDGLLVFPALFVMYFTLVLQEERGDMGVRFREQYGTYKQTTRMFGPVWLWTAILSAVLLIAVSAQI